MALEETNSMDMGVFTTGHGFKIKHKPRVVVVLVSNGVHGDEARRGKQTTRQFEIQAQHEQMPLILFQQQQERQRQWYEGRMGNVFFMFVFTIVGFIIGRVTHKHKKDVQLAFRKPEDQTQELGQEQEQEQEQDQDQDATLQSSESWLRRPASSSSSSLAEDTIWLNTTISSLWYLFRTNTRFLIRDVLNPVLQEMKVNNELPPFIDSILIQSVKVGSKAPSMREITVLDSRSVSQPQYTVQTNFVSDESEIILSVFMYLFPNQKSRWEIPVVVRNLEMDAKVWVKLNLVPYPPFVSDIQYGLLEYPNVMFSLRIGKHGILTNVPVLRQLFFKIVTQVIPASFLLPRKVNIPIAIQLVDPEKFINKYQALPYDYKKMDQQMAVAKFPELYSLFTLLDTDKNGELSPEEIHQGIVEWGYCTAQLEDIVNQLDINQDGKVSFVEFCVLWPKIQSELVPKRYRGRLRVYVYNVKNVYPRPFVGRNELMLEIRVGGEKRVSKRRAKMESGIWDSWYLFGRSTLDLPHWLAPPSSAVASTSSQESKFEFRESFELLVDQPPEKGAVEFSIRETSWVCLNSNWESMTGNVLAQAKLPIEKIYKQGAQKLSLFCTLSTPGGEDQPKPVINLQVLYTEFIDNE